MRNYHYQTDHILYESDRVGARELLILIIIYMIYDIYRILYQADIVGVRVLDHHQLVVLLHVLHPLRCLREEVFKYTYTMYIQVTFISLFLAALVHFWRWVLTLFFFDRYCYF